MYETILLAVALSMDAFAVSIGLGSKPGRAKLRLAVLAAIYFGVFQGLMPFVGYFAGRGVLGWVEAFAPWIAFVLLVGIGGKMIFESLSEGIEEDIVRITHRVLLMLAIATSIDAMAAGFALNLLPLSAWLACAIIAVTTAVFSFAGVYVGAKTGTWLESKAGLLGGCVLILIAMRLAFFS